MGNYFPEAVFDAFLVAWLVVAVFLAIKWRVGSPRPLREAPPRAGTMSLMVAAGVFLLYLFTLAAVLLLAIECGLVSRADVGMEPAATQPAGTQAPSTAATDTAPATLPAALEDAGTRNVHGGIIMTAVYLLLAGPVIFLVCRLFPRGSRDWGLHVSQLPAGIVAGLLAFVISFPFLFLSEVGLTWLYGAFHHEMSTHPTMQALNEPTLPLAQQAFLVVLASLVAPFAEEVFFRGIVQTSLIQRGWGLVIPQMAPPSALRPDFRPSAGQRFGAILLTSAAFGYVHALDQAPIIFLLAICLGYVYERTGNLWAAITLHAAFNGGQMGLDKIFHAMGVQ